MKEHRISHLVKGEDLNHHGTLFAARGAAWLVESAFIAASCGQESTSGLVCRNLNDMYFKKPVRPGTILELRSRIVHAGTTSLMVHVLGMNALTKEEAMEGYVTFVTIEEGSSKKRPHGITLDEPEGEEEHRQREAAAQIRNR